MKTGDVSNDIREDKFTMMCPLCVGNEYHAETWSVMRQHIKDFHPEEKRPDKLFTKEARSK